MAEAEADMIDIDKIAKLLYKAWVAEMDPKHGKDNYPKWGKLTPHAKRTWRAMAAVVIQL